MHVSLQPGLGGIVYIYLSFLAVKTLVYVWWLAPGQYKCHAVLITLEIEHILIHAGATRYHGPGPVHLALMTTPIQYIF